MRTTAKATTRKRTTETPRLLWSERGQIGCKLPGHAPYRGDYSRVRPHTSLGGLSPEQFIAGLTGAMAPVKPVHATQPQHDLPFPEETPC